MSAMCSLAAALCVTINSEKKSNEHFISLRDYDFVGEDVTLVAVLSERMAALRAPEELPAPERGAPRAPAPTWRPHFQVEPDYLQSNVRRPHLVNVSLDYAELLNASDLILELNATSAPGPSGAPVPGAGGAPVPGQGTVSSPGLSAVSNLELSADMDGRRRISAPVRDPSLIQYNSKIMNLMKQTIYSCQLKILELEPVIKRYQTDPRFRMAYIYNRLDEWKHDMRTVYYAMARYRWHPRRVKRTIWYYEHMLRMDIDITYSIEHLIYLHHEYVKKLEMVAPLAQRKELWALKKRQEKLDRMEKRGITLPRLMHQK